jgi:hypothetical protein
MVKGRLSVRSKVISLDRNGPSGDVGPGDTGFRVEKPSVEQGASPQVSLRFKGRLLSAELQK